MTLDRLKEVAQFCLEMTKTRLVAERALTPIVTMLLPDGSFDIVALDGRIMSSPDGKERLFRVLKKVCRAKHAEALIMVSDGWTLDQTKAQIERTSNPEGAAELMRASEKGGVPAAAAAGFGTLMECITCMAQTPEHVYCLMQMYQRVAPDGVIPGSALLVEGNLPEDYTIRFYGDQTHLSNRSGQISGRFSGIFDEVFEDNPA